MGRVGIPARGENVDLHFGGVEPEESGGASGFAVGEHEGDGAVEAEGGIVDVFEDVEVEEAIGFGVVDVWASGGPEGEGGGAFGDAVEGIGGVEGDVEADGLGAVGSGVGVGAESLFPIVAFGFVLEGLEVEEAAGVEGDDAVAGGVVADEELEGVVAEDGGVAVGEEDGGGGGVVLGGEAGEPELGGGEIGNDDVGELEALLGRGEGGVFVDSETEDGVLVNGEGEDQGFGMGIVFGGEFGGEVAVGDCDVGGGEGGGAGGAGSGSLAEWGLVAGSEFVFLPGEGGAEVEAEEEEEEETQRFVPHLVLTVESE